MADLLPGCTQYPIGEGLDKADLLRLGNEVFRRYHSALGMRPTHQGLNSGDCVGSHIYLWLIVKYEFVVFNRFSELCQKDQALPGLRLALAAVERILDA